MSKSELRRMEIVAPDAIKQLREQIAREIEICEPCFNDVWCGKDEKNQDCSCICHQYAAIARGEPNQVTKDAIEEARKMNDLR